MTNTLQASGLDILKIGHYMIDNINYNTMIDIPNKKYDIVVIIAFQGRYTMMGRNIETLNRQTDKIGIIIIGSDKDDNIFINQMMDKYENVHGYIIKNFPCGLKWQYGVYLSRFFINKGIIILGSDDLLSLNYVKVMKQYLDEGYDLIGKREWYLIDNDDTNIYQLNYTDKFIKNRDMSLGAGRVYSKRILDRCNYMIFDFLRNNCLDEYGCIVVNQLEGKVDNDNKDDIHILSIKGNWKQINTFDKMKKYSKIDDPYLRIKENTNKILNKEWQLTYYGDTYYDLASTDPFNDLLYNLKSI
jgi:hypothetical protein